MILKFLILISCTNKPGPSEVRKKQRANDYLPDSLSALANGRKLLIEKYHIDSISNTFSAVLLEDSIWHVVSQSDIFETDQVKDTTHIDRGSERILINKHSCDIIGF